MSCDCGCCAGARVTTPVAEENRPGLSRISHRPGRYATFLETMVARLSSVDFPELALLKSRSASDASIALCDAWAIAADVLAFYQDRIANEGYLRTATERRSLLELGRLTGYAMRPGVSASVYLAYEIDPNAQSAEIPIGTRAQSVPGPGEKMQTFETAEPLSARAAWSRIKVRLGQPQWREPPPLAEGAGRQFGDAYDVLKQGLYLQGASTQLKPNDALLIDYGDVRVPYRIDAATVSDDQTSTRVMLREWSSAGSTAASARAARRARSASAARAGAVERAAAATPPAQRQAASISDLVGQLSQSLTVQPRNALTVPRSVTATLRAGGDVYSRLLIRQTPALDTTLYSALSSTHIAQPSIKPIKVYALRTKAALFGNSAPGRVVTNITGGGNPSVSYGNLGLQLAWNDLSEFAPGAGVERKLAHVPLDAPYEQIKAGDSVTPSYLVLDAGAAAIEDAQGGTWPRILTVTEARTATMSIGVAMSARVTQLLVDDSWLTYPIKSGSDLRVRAAVEPAFPLDVELLRRTQVYAQSEELPLAADPLIEAVAGDVSANEIELDAFYDGLKVGQWLIAGGERDLDQDDAHVNVAERAMISAVRHGLTRLMPTAALSATQGGDLPGDTLHTFIKLAAPLAYRYKRTTFTLYGNVVRATHGETRRETLGAGDATQVFQTFALRSPPLTYIAAPTPDGTDSTLQVRVQNLLWSEVDSLVDAGPADRGYITRRDNSEVTRIVFGDGQQGARLPTGQDNVTAAYRCGIGSAGNVRAGQLTLPTDKPLGVKGVDNPIRASGGAEADTLDMARVNEPLAVTALDRLVGVQDYADFSRTFAGIGKAAATRLHDGHESLVHVTIAGIDDVPIDVTSDLYVNLVEALHDFGDPHVAIRVEIREALSLVIQAKVAIKPEYSWDDVQPRVASALYARFGFQARELGQPVIGSEILGVIAGVRGVAHVLGLDFKLLDYDELVAGLAPTSPSAPAPGSAGTADPPPADADTGTPAWLALESARIANGASGQSAPAQIAYLAAGVPEALLLELAS